MSTEPVFRPFRESDRPACLALFDANCPEFFAPKERHEYGQHLDARPSHYSVCLLGDEVVGAYGLEVAPTGHARLQWILFSPTAQGRGLGSVTMSRVLRDLEGRGVSTLEISASHRSAPFFARFGAEVVATTADGWGPGMHRVDMRIER